MFLLFADEDYGIIVGKAGEIIMQEETRSTVFFFKCAALCEWQAKRTLRKIEKRDLKSRSVDKLKFSREILVI